MIVLSHSEAIRCRLVRALAGSKGLPYQSTRGRRANAWVSVLIAAAVLLAGVLPSFPAQDSHNWKTYTNERFGFSVCYPSDLLHPGVAPDNNGGRTFIGFDGGRLAAWGSWNAMGSTLAESANEDKKRFAEGAGKITYSLVRNDFYVISGTSGDQTFYNHTAFANGKFSAVELTYPTAESARWNPIVARVSQCFEPDQTRGGRRCRGRCPFRGRI